MGCLKLLYVCLCYLYIGSAQDTDTSPDVYQENHKPIFRECSNYNPTVKENQYDGIVVLQVHAEDPDPPSTPNGNITYKIEAQQENARQDFEVDPITGVIKTLRAFDRDEPNNERELYVTVRATDQGRTPLADVCTFKVTVEDVNDNAPLIDRQEYISEVSEDFPVNSEILRVSAYDIDKGENANLTYMFINDDSGTKFNNFFSIDPETGVIYLTKSLTGKRDDVFKTSVVVRDNGKPEPLSANVEITLRVVDSGKKPPTIKSFDNRISVEENNKRYFDEPLITLTADSNSQSPHVYFEILQGKTVQTNRDQTFTAKPIDPSGAQIFLARSLDYEVATEYQISISARNDDSLYTYANIFVSVEDVNDEMPEFLNLGKGSVVENDNASALVLTVKAIDKDGTSPNNKVVYGIRDFQDKFTIDPNTGVITTLVPLDREEKNSYNLWVYANDSAPSAHHSDNKPNSAIKSFEIIVEDQNDNQPKFTRALYIANNISESLDTQRDVIEVKAIDVDTDSKITYSIIEGNRGDAFYIEPTTGRIKVNKQLDYEKIQSYNLTVRAFDGIYDDTTRVIIPLINENDEPPQFEPYKKEIQFPEEQISDNCIIRLQAYDPDLNDRSVDQKIVYNVAKGYESFISVDNNGCIKIITPLDRDKPNGTPTRQAFIFARDNNGEQPSLQLAAEIVIVLEDINDNAPYLDITKVVWYENQPPGSIMTLTASDNDEESNGNGPPFTFEIAPTEPDILDKFKISGSELFATVEFDREERKFYNIPIKISDSGDPRQTDISTLTVIIGDKNDNKAQDGKSEIFVYKYEGFKTDTEIGRVYVNDLDDWDLPDKSFYFDGPQYTFYLRDAGMIVMRNDTEPGNYTLRFDVNEQIFGETNKVKADVVVTVKGLPEEAVLKSGSVRLQGVTVEQFIETDGSSVSKKDLLQKRLSEIFNTSVENVDVFTVMTTPTNSSFVDVRFSAHGSPYYAPEKLNYQTTEQQDLLESELGVDFYMISINECLIKNNCSNSSCASILSIKDEPAVVFTNKTSFVGVKAVVEAVCQCVTRPIIVCYNGGTPLEDGSVCNCPEGYDGPHCENLSIGFTGDGWAMYPTFDSCNSTGISLNVLPQTGDGLIFYAGPVTKRQAQLSTDFISLELRDGFAVFKMEVEGNVNELVSDYRKIDDGAVHKIVIKFSTTDIQMEVDDCPSDCLRWTNLRKSGLFKTNGPLQVGGRSDILTEEQAKNVWDNPPSSHGFRGCVTNFTYNSYVYNLGEPSYKHNVHAGSCNYATFQAATFGIDSNFLVAILVCLAILLILLLAVVVHKRKQDNLNEKEMDDTRANIINYEDEGGGECDTNFDLSVFPPNVDKKPPIRENLLTQAADVPADIGSFLDDKKRACDKDTLPYDDVRHYAYEGDGNSSGSLSSLASCTDEGDLKFNYLSSFGPRFRKLADMYGDDASEEGSGEESWC